MNPRRPQPTEEEVMKNSERMIRETQRILAELHAGRGSRGRVVLMAREELNRTLAKLHGR